MDAAKLQEIVERGFTVVPDVLPRADIPALRAQLEQFIADDLQRWGKAPGFIDSWMVHNPMARDIRFARVLENRAMHEYLSAVLGDTCILYAFTTSSMPPGGSNYSHRVHHDCPRLIPGYVTNMGVILPLDDFTADNGATYFLPSSFKLADPVGEQEFFAKAERVYARAGDAVFFNARTLHYGPDNKTQTARHALTLNVCRSFMRSRFDYPRLMPKAIVDQLDETARRFLGFNVRMPTSLDEYYVPSDQRLYKPNQG